MTEAKRTPLAQVGVIVTRPAGQATSLKRLLEEQGAQVLLFPTLKIEAVRNAMLTQVVHDLDLYHHLIFISVNAVQNSVPALENYWPQWPVKQAWYAVGNATASALKRYGVDPIVPPVDHSSEGLLSLGALQSLENQRVCLFRGEAGRLLLQETLLQRGAEVNEVSCYRRETAQKSPAEHDQLGLFLQRPCAKFLIASSNESLDKFLLLAEGSQYASAGLVVVAASERIGRHAKQSGFSKIAQAKGAGDKRLLEAIQEWCDNPPSYD